MNDYIGKCEGWTLFMLMYKAKRKGKDTYLTTKLK